MDRRHSILIAILIATIGCGSPKRESSSNTASSDTPPSSSSPTASAPLPTPPVTNTAGGEPPVLAGMPPTSSHTISLNASTDPGNSGSPSIVTCVSERGRDTITWVTANGSTLGNPAFPAGTNLGPYAIPASCNGATQCTVTYNIALCPGGTCYPNTYSYTINVVTGVLNVPIYGHIIINK